MLLSEERWTSASLPPPRQLPGFQEVFDRTHFHWGLSRAGSDAYHAELRRRAIDDFVFTDIVCDPVTGYRTHDDVRRGADDYFCLLYFDEGNCLLRQGRNESVVRRDTIAVWDSTRPAMFQNSDQLHQLSIMIPHRMAKTIVPGIEDMCGLTVDGSAGLGAILLSHLRQIHRTVDTVAPQDRAAVLRATVELVAAAFRPAPERLAGTSFRRALLNRVQDHIVAHLGDPSLSAATIAQAFRFSPRYLHRLFEEFGVTVGTWIRERRLQSARADLADHASAHLNITEIAMRHGFADASHFSHAFRGAFGMSPRAWRTEAARSAASSLQPK
ncbi:helix-turn-helix domain-containing protein [Sphingopyxis sp. XHP0097]|jgi:AraC-like DNA-binding protein|uniref:Helix-turn-helix domain-containing protein n=1 Tax=Sphingopyxis jiangsuensis TaxID=2871171 RepID=A0ABS7MJ32_9SPHN|nr:MULTISPECIES: helix-turn-helix domain-containing protein [Sphingopyxis]MBL0768806.1 helix-turn-helix domain-containing protein [Sphingopyxis lutea]MBY4638086.1 helix-turn-helix domain-containing protein [Sphingopyxis jiangsuensis]